VGSTRKPLNFARKRMTILAHDAENDDHTGDEYKNGISDIDFQDKCDGSDGFHTDGDDEVDDADRSGKPKIQFIIAYMMVYMIA